MASGERAFAWRISVISGLGFASAVVIATYVDARITSHVSYHPRIYRYGYWLSSFGLVIALLTFASINRVATRAGKSVISVIWLILGLLLSLPVFAPEIPHSGMTGAVTMYGFVVAVAVWIRYSHIETAFLGDSSVPLAARVEAIRSLQLIWQAIAIATIGGFLAVLVPWFGAILKTDELITKSASDLFLLNRFSLLQMGLICLACVLGPIREVVAKLLEIPRLWASLRE